MSRCPSCDYPLPADRERLGARCPNCRDPLYEPPGRLGRPAREGEGSCAVHTGVETVGICARCGNYLCEVCRTQWRGQIICGACVQRALETKEASPEASRQNFIQAMLSVGLGIGAWVLTALGLLASVLVLASGSATGQIIGVVAFFAFLAAGLAMAVFGVGNAASVLRARGSSMILAIAGLLICCLHIGVFIGMFVMGIWQG
jgi:hypothetical protein